jgi:hypothetical protein
MKQEQLTGDYMRKVYCPLCHRDKDVEDNVVMSICHVCMECMKENNISMEIKNE